MTRRQEIIEMLTSGKISAQHLANFYRVEMLEILEDLDHIKSTVRPSQELHMYPAECKSCGFVFKERNRVKAPSKCPRCRSEFIKAPQFTIKSASRRT